VTPLLVPSWSRVTWTDLPPDELASRVRDSAEQIEQQIRTFEALQGRVRGGGKLFDWDAQIERLRAVHSFLGAVAEEAVDEQPDTR
jgi:hypothetical protein